MTAADPHLRGADRVREVFARVRNGDLGVADLYAEDGVIVYGDGGRVEGRDAIRAFYARAIEGNRPEPRVETILEAPLDKRNFRKKILSMNFLVATEEVQKDVSHRAARLYRFDRKKYQQLQKRGFNFEI